MSKWMLHTSLEWAVTKGESLLMSQRVNGFVLQCRYCTLSQASRDQRIKLPTSKSDIKVQLDEAESEILGLFLHWLRSCRGDKTTKGAIMGSDMRNANRTPVTHCSDSGVQCFGARSDKAVTKWVDDRGRTLRPIRPSWVSAVDTDLGVWLAPPKSRRKRWPRIDHNRWLPQTCRKAHFPDTKWPNARSGSA